MVIVVYLVYKIIKFNKIIKVGNKIKFSIKLSNNIKSIFSSLCLLENNSNKIKIIKFLVINYIFLYNF